MANLILILDRIIGLYLYFIVGACLLSWVPNINPDYPLFHYIFKFAGFYLLPPVMGFSFSPALVMVVCALLMMGLEFLYKKFYANKEPDIIVMSSEEFIENVKKYSKQKKDNKDDSN